jgi:ribosome biogenesis GTPase
MESTGLAIVISVQARSCTVVSESDGQEITCHLRGRLFEKLKGETKPVAVGDRVSFRITEQGAALEEILPRRNALTRPAKGKKGEVQTIAANIDRMIVVASVKNPPLRTGLIDRFLVAAGIEEFEGVICLNKIDLIATEEEREMLSKEVAGIYTGLGYAVFMTSALDGRGVKVLEERMSRGISLIMGHSGVGKSTLINRMNPALGLKTGEVSAKWSKGKHTTTEVSLLRLAAGGFVVDTPGIRAFGIQDILPGDLGHYYPEIASLLKHCQYPTCTHSHEPRCAVISAVNAGQISRARYKSYLRILEELEQE